MADPRTALRGGFYPMPETPAMPPVPYRIPEQSGPQAPPGIPGMTAFGNIDLTARPRVQNPDGSYSTVRSMGANIGGEEVLFPTVSDAGRVMSDEEAVQNYLATGKHLGKFNSPGASDFYARGLHEDQQRQFEARPGVGPSTPIPSQDDLVAGILAEKRQRPVGADLRSQLAADDPGGPIFLDDPFEHGAAAQSTPPAAVTGATPKKKKRKVVP